MNMYGVKCEAYFTGTQQPNNQTEVKAEVEVKAKAEIKIHIRIK
jgi:hypothetical protein